MIAPWNVYRTKDGWLLLCANSDQQWQRLCELMGRPELVQDTMHMPDRVRRVDDVDAAVRKWLALETIASAQDILGKTGISCGPVATLDQCPREQNLDYRAMIQSVVDPVGGKTIFLPAYPVRTGVSKQAEPIHIPVPDQDRDLLNQLSAGDFGVPSSRALNGATHGLPLAGIRVLEIGHYTTVPLCARHLAALGAEVIKIEPPSGEAVRSFPPLVDGMSLYFQSTHAGKKSLVLDLETPEGVQALRALVCESDVLVENLKPGSLARRGFSWDAMRLLNKRLVYCAVSGFGLDSLYEGRPAVDLVIQAMSGMMDVNRSGNMPMKTGISSADILGAELALFGVLAALAYRDRHGEGQQIDLSMQDVCAWSTQTLWNENSAGAQAQVHECTDGFVLVQMPTKPLHSGSTLENVMTQLAGSPAIKSHELVQRLAAQGIVATPILSSKDIVAHPQTVARKLWFHAPSNGRQWPLLASPMRLLGSPVQIGLPMGPLGGDTEIIMASLALNRAPRPSANG